MFFTEWKDQLGEVWMSDISCLILITPDFHWEEQTFIKCEQTNLISVVSKLENLLTKLIFQFYSISPHPSWLFSLCICIIVLSPLRTWFITFTLVWNDISFLRRWRMLSICVSVVTVSVSITGNVAMFNLLLSVPDVSMYYPLSNFCSICYTVTLYGITLYRNEKSHLSL